MKYAMINSTTNVVENCIELSDQDLLPPIPLESEKPILPVKPTNPPEPELPLFEDDADAELVAQMKQEYQDAQELWGESCNALRREYEQECAAYDIKANEFNDKFRAATQFRWSPPEGFFLVKINDEDVVVIGATRYENNALINGQD